MTNIRYACNHFDKSKTILNCLSNIQNEEWQPDLVTRQGNDRICRTNYTFFLKRLYIRIRCDLHFSLQSSSDTRKWRNLSNERFIVCKKLCFSLNIMINGRRHFQLRGMKHLVQTRPYTSVQNSANTKYNHLCMDHWLSSYGNMMIIICSLQIPRQYK